jgi:hypothetical protein
MENEFTTYGHVDGKGKLSIYNQKGFIKKIHDYFKNSSIEILFKNRFYKFSDKARSYYFAVIVKEIQKGWLATGVIKSLKDIDLEMRDKFLFYEELNEDADFFTNHVVALDLLNKYLDNIEYRNEMADQALGCVINDLVYKDEIEKMSDYIDQLVDKLPCVGQTEKVDEIIEWIKKEKVISKKNLIDRLNWGVGIKFTQYRRRLLTNPNIYDTISEYPNYCWRPK